MFRKVYLTNSSSNLTTSLMSLRTLGLGLYGIDHPLVVGGMHLGARTTVVELSPRRASGGRGELLVHAPGPMDEEDVRAIRALGDVVAIVAPNNLHHLFLGAAKNAFAEATVYAPRSLSEKVRGLPVDAPLEGSPWAGVFEAIPIEGVPKMGETAFIHAPSKTLVATDLAFNLRPPKPWLTRTIMKLNGGFDRFGPTKLFRSMVKDEGALRRSLDAILEHDFDRIVVAHGDVLEAGGKAALRETFVPR